MFDCVLPTRLGRTGSATTWEGRLNLRNARFARDEGPLQEGCECPACTRFSRAYIRHLVTQDELLGLRLLTLHNLLFLLDLCREARACDPRGRFGAFAEEALERLGSGTAQSARRAPGAVKDGGRSRVRLDRRHRRADVVPVHPPAAADDGAPARGARARSRTAIRSSPSAGMYGTIVGLDGDEVRLEIAPDVVVRVARRAVAGRVGVPPAGGRRPEARPSRVARRSRDRTDLCRRTTSMGSRVTDRTKNRLTLLAMLVLLGLTAVVAVVRVARARPRPQGRPRGHPQGRPERPQEPADRRPDQPGDLDHPLARRQARRE